MIPTRALTRSLVIFFVLTLDACGGKVPPARISAADARFYLGRDATVCGDVVRTHFAVGVNGQPTFLDLDRQHPNALFTVVIWGMDRRRFNPQPDQLFRDRRICVTGRILMFEYRPQIVVRRPSEIVFDDDVLFP